MCATKQSIVFFFPCLKFYSNTLPTARHFLEVLAVRQETPSDQNPAIVHKKNLRNLFPSHKDRVSWVLGFEFRKTRFFLRLFSANDLLNSVCVFLSLFWIWNLQFVYVPVGCLLSVWSDVFCDAATSFISERDACKRSSLTIC